jgi:hypothetical protein
MTGLSRINFEELAAKFDFSQYRTLCDVGGATALLSIEVAKKHPHIECVSFDLLAGRIRGEEAHFRIRVEQPRSHRIRRFL